MEFSLRQRSPRRSEKASNLNGSHRGAFSRVQVLFAHHAEVILLLALAAVVYQPWNTPGLPILDFSEFLPRLAAHTSLWARFVGVTEYLATQGRFSPIQYLYVALTWSAFGIQASGWHWTYFAINAGVLLLARNVLLRMGVRRSAALVTLSLWAMMKPFADGWLRPTGETLGLLFVLGGLRVALGYADAPDWRRSAILIAGCAAAAVFAKEMLVVLIPVIWLVARLGFRGGALLGAPWTRRDKALTIALAITLVLALTPVAYVALHAPLGSYASRYGTEHVSFAASLERLEITFFPGRERLSTLIRVLGDPAWRLLLVLPNLVWLALIADGLTTRSARKNVWPVLIGILWISAGVIAYIPWPGHAAFYMLPFGFGMVIIAAHALTWLFDRGGMVGRGALVMASVLAGITAIEARDLVHEHDLRVKLDTSIIESLSRLQGLNNVVAAVPEPGRPGSWGWARKLTEFGRVVNRMPSIRSNDMSCADARMILATVPGTAVVSAQEGCGMLARGSEVLASVPLRRWPILWKAQRINRVAFVATFQPHVSK